VAIARHGRIAVAPARRQILEERPAHERHVARDDQGPFRGGTLERGVEASERADSRNPIRDHLDASTEVAFGATHDDDAGSTAAEHGELAIDDPLAADDERTLVVAAQAAGLAAGQDMRVPDHAGDRLGLFNLSEIHRMRDGGIGRVLVAALHQGIADLLPARQEFYENWFNPAGLRAGRLGLAPLTAVLSFLRREGDGYGRVTGRAGEYAADWTVDGLSPLRRAAVRALPRHLRARLALGVARDLVLETYGGSRAIMRMRAGGAMVDIRGSIFCGVREPAPSPLCGFYKAAFARVLERFDLPAIIEITSCRGTGRDGCFVTITLTPVESSSGQPAMLPDRSSEISA
jgi:hypothetical protein